MSVMVEWSKDGDTMFDHSCFDIMPALQHRKSFEELTAASSRDRSAMSCENFQTFPQKGPRLDAFMNEGTVRPLRQGKNENADLPFIPHRPCIPGAFDGEVVQDPVKRMPCPAPSNRRSPTYVVASIRDYFAYSRKQTVSLHNIQAPPSPGLMSLNLSPRWSSVRSENFWQSEQTTANTEHTSEQTTANTEHTSGSNLLKRFRSPRISPARSILSFLGRKASKKPKRDSKPTNAGEQTENIVPDNLVYTFSVENA
eukprot:3433413-Rhodomonas_salina.3